MQVIKHHSHKNAEQLFITHKPEILTEIYTAIEQINAVECLAKVSSEKSKVNKWGGLLFSPIALNYYFKKDFLLPNNWLTWDQKLKKYREPALLFQDDTTISGADRRRSMDGLKDRVGLEIQFGKYTFMGYDVFSKMIIFNKLDYIDYGIEIVLVQEMIDSMSTGVSAFEHLMIDFQYRGEADIDIPVFVIGIGPTDQEWAEVKAIQSQYRNNPTEIIEKYPNISRFQSKGTKPGPK